MNDFHKLEKRFDVAGIRESILSQPDLWDLNKERTYSKDSPHSEVSDIWVRYNDIEPYRLKGDFTGINDEHTSVWYKEAGRISGIKKLTFDLMHEVGGERLGGILITRVRPGGKIERHTDKSWHAEYYSKFYIPIQNAPGAEFHFDTGVIKPEEGECYWFDNSCPHWVVNESDKDRIALIICIKTENYDGQRHAL